MRVNKIFTNKITGKISKNDRTLQLYFSFLPFLIIVVQIATKEIKIEIFLQLHEK